MSDKRSHFSKTGGYNGYKKNHKERAENDYYSTPSAEVLNILKTLNIDFSDDDVILENSCGGGHMVNAITDYCDLIGRSPLILAADVKNRIPNKQNRSNLKYYFGEEYDFLSENYPLSKEVDYVIMNPPYATLEPFIMKSLALAKKGVIVLARIQALETQGRYENIFSIYPPSDVYVYVDRISCYKNGDTSIKENGSQAYCWLVFKPESTETKLHWIRRSSN